MNDDTKYLNALEPLPGQKPVTRARTEAVKIVHDWLAHHQRGVRDCPSLTDRIEAALLKTERQTQAAGKMTKNLSLLRPKVGDYVQITSCDWYVWTGEEWLEMTAEQQMEASK